LLERRSYQRMLFQAVQQQEEMRAGTEELRQSNVEIEAEHAEIAAEHAEIREGLRLGGEELSELASLFRRVIENSGASREPIEWQANPYSDWQAHLFQDDLYDFLCPISREVMQEPVIAGDEKTYDRWALQVWYDSGKRTCPMVPSAELTNPAELPVNETLKERIEAGFQLYNSGNDEGASAEGHGPRLN